jgi:hypothetical protein
MDLYVFKLGLFHRYPFLRFFFDVAPFAVVVDRRERTSFCKRWWSSAAESMC